MLKVENFETYGWQAAIRGMRNPMNSWDKSDSGYCEDVNVPCSVCPEMKQINQATKECNRNPNEPRFYILGANDMDLCERLRQGGADDRKFMRQIFVSCDITAPLYWWKEMDQYKVATTTNSCSTMHKIHAKEFTKDDFSHEWITDDADKILDQIVESLNHYRNLYSQEQNPVLKKYYWMHLIQLLPSSYNQKRTWTANYEVLANIYQARCHHKLQEWHVFCDEILKLPYAKQLILGEKE